MGKVSGGGVVGRAGGADATAPAREPRPTAVRVGDGPETRRTTIGAGSRRERVAPESGCAGGRAAALRPVSRPPGATLL